MNKVFQLLVLCLLISPIFSQTVDADKFRTCIGKVTTILNESAKFVDNKPVNAKCPIDYKSDEFKEVWSQFQKQTNNFKSISINKVYEIKGIPRDGIESWEYDNPIEWSITFTAQNIMQFNQHCSMGRVYSQNFNAKYNLLTNEYETKYTSGEYGNNGGGNGYSGDTYIVEIRNDVVINRHIDH